MDHRDLDCMSMYYSDVAKTVPVTPDEERRLIARWQQKKDVSARHALVQSHLRFVITLAHRFSRDPDRLPDLIAAGNIGLLHALDRFDLSKQTRFLTYAGWWIQKEILEEDYGSLITVPTHRKKKRRKRAKAFRAALAQFGPEASEVKRLDPGTPEGATVALDALAESAEPEDPTPPQDYEVGQTRRHVGQALTSLRLQEQTVVTLYFGFKGAPRTLVQIARLLGLSTERVRQIKSAAMEKLRQALGPAWLSLNESF